MDSKIIRLIIFFLIPLNSYAAEFQGNFRQGSFILAKTKAGSQVQIDNRKIRVSKDGYFAFGLGRDRKNDIIIKIFKDGKLEVFEKKVLIKKKC